MGNPSTSRVPSSTTSPDIDPQMRVDEVMRRLPGTVAVFLRHGMLCVGCAFGRFCTIADGCAAHGMELAPFLAELDRASAVPQPDDQSPICAGPAR